MNRRNFKKWVSAFTAFVFLFQQISPAFAMEPEDDKPQKSIKKEDYQTKKDRYEQQRIERHLTLAQEEEKQGNDALAAYHRSEAEKILNEQEDRHLAASIENPQCDNLDVPFNNNPSFNGRGTASLEQDFFPVPLAEEESEIKIESLLHCISDIIRNNPENYQNLCNAVMTDTYSGIEKKISEIKSQISSNTKQVTEDDKVYEIILDKTLDAKLKKALKEEKKKLKVIANIRRDKEQEFSHEEVESENHSHRPSFLITEEELQNGAIFDEVIASIMPKPIPFSSKMDPSNLPTRNTVDMDEEEEATEEQKEQAIKSYFEAIKKQQKPTPEQEKIFSRIARDLIKELKGISATFSRWVGPLVIVLGKTGVGKTILTKWLTHHPLNAILEDPSNENILNLESKVTEGDEIVHGVRSGTTIPGLWKDPEGKVVYADCPGLEDTRGTLQRIRNAYYVQELFKNRNDVRLLIVVSGAFFEDRVGDFVKLLSDLKAMFRDDYLLKNGLSLVVTKHHPYSKSLPTIKRLMQDLSLQKENNSIKELLDYFSKGEDRIALFSRPRKAGPFQNDDERKKILYNINASVPLLFSFKRDINLSLPDDAILWCERIQKSLTSRMVDLFNNKIAPEVDLYIKSLITENKKLVDGFVDDAMKLYTPFVLVCSPSQEGNQDIHQAIKARTLANTHWPSLWAITASIGKMTGNVLKTLHDYSGFLDVASLLKVVPNNKSVLFTQAMLGITNGDWNFLKSYGLRCGFNTAIATLSSLTTTISQALSKGIPLTTLTQTTIEAVSKGMPIIDSTQITYEAVTKGSPLFRAALTSALYDDKIMPSDSVASLLTAWPSAFLPRMSMTEVTANNSLLFDLTKAATTTVSYGAPLIARGIAVCIVGAMMEWVSSSIKNTYFIKKENWKIEMTSRIKELKRKDLSAEFNRLAKELRMAKFDIHAGSLLGNNGLLRRIKPGANGYSLRLMFENPATESLNLINQGELGLFCEGDKLYCKLPNKEKIQILRSEGPSSQGYDAMRFDRIMGTLKDSINLERYKIALQQEEEGKQGLASFNYNLAFKSIEPQDREALFNYTLLRGYTHADISADISEIKATAKSLECIYQISGKNNLHFSQDIWQPTFSSLEKALKQYAKQSAEALYTNKSVISITTEPEAHTFKWLNTYGSEGGIKPVRIGLSVDGGGTRGLIPALYLEEIEDLARKPICELFDIFGGTSVGGILGLGFVVPGANGLPLYQAGEFVKLFREQGKTIFSVHSSSSQERVYQTVGISWKARYKPEPLEAILSQKFNKIPLSAALKPIVIPAVQTEQQVGESCVYLFDSWLAARNPQKNFYMKDVARATAAAPTYFPAANISSILVEGALASQLSLLDGGFLANNPSERVYKKMLELWPGSQHSIVSFGTGVGPKHDLPENAGTVGFAKTGIETLMIENEQGICKRLSDPKALGRHYVRVQTDLGREIGLDDATDSTLDFLQEKAEERLNDLEDITRFLLINHDAWSDAGGRNL